MISKPPSAKDLNKALWDEAFAYRELHGSHLEAWTISFRSWFAAAIGKASKETTTGSLFKDELQQL